MKTRACSSGLRAMAASTMAAAMAVLFSGCERSPSAASSSGLAEVRGAPIQALAKMAEPAPQAEGPQSPSRPSSSPSASSSNEPAVSISRAAGTPIPASASTGTPATEPEPGRAVSSSTSATPAAAQPLTAASPGPIPAGPTSAERGPIALNFDQLAGYTFEVSDELLGPVTNDVAGAKEKTNSKIPNTVKSYDRKKVALKGFMLPLKVEGGLVTEMLIMKDQSMCCYGTTPRINDWVSVKMKKKGVRPTMDLPVTLFGTMRIGEMRENGYLVGIYSMDGEEMEAPEAQ